MKRIHSPNVRIAVGPRAALTSLAACAACLAFVALAASPADAATYRCQAGKSVAYSDRPCPTGQTGGTVDIEPANPGDADAAAAARRAKNDAAQLKHIDAQHDKELRQSAGEEKRARREKEARSKRCAKLEMKVKHAREDLASATLREEAKRRTKLKRAEEAYVVECR